LLEFSMYPTDKGESVSDYVKRSLAIIDDSGLPYKLGPMGTCLEGDIDEVLAVMKQCFSRMSEDSNRIACVMKFDYRRGQKPVENLRDLAPTVIRLAVLEHDVGQRLVCQIGG